ncbi:MAG: sigma-70 family RNA polymerase sigma factor [Verrucomicrobia bacterium]|nr:sigma-70 family RNA polymerase sigma factor [Verrucomicrobiota bacterium]
MSVAATPLLRRCLAGEASAWDELFDTHYGPVFRFVHQLSGGFTREDTEEICQETFVAVVRNLRDFDGRSAFQTWLFRIAANKAYDFRSRQLAAKRGGGVANVTLDDEDAPDPPSEGLLPDEALLQAENAGLLREALERIGEPCREIIELRYFADLSYEEISAALQLNAKTVSSRLSKCLDKLGEIARRVFSAGTRRPDPV